MTTNRNQRRAAAAAASATTLLAAPAVALAAPFWGVSLLTRRLSAALPLEPPSSNWPELIEYQPEIGCMTRPDLDVHARAQGPFRLTTDAEGWRGELPLDDADLLVFGDSFAFGYGVDDDDMYTSHIDGISAKGVGTVAYSMVHAVLWMERLQNRLRGRPVVLLPYYGNDLDRNLHPDYLRYRMPFVRRRGGSWEIVTEHVSSEPWPFPETPSELDPLARICTPGHESSRTIDAAAYLIDRARDICAQAGSSLTVMSVPQRSQIDAERLPDIRDRSPDPEAFDPALPDTELRRRCEASGIPFVALADHLEPADYFDEDIHWRPSGHRKLGRLLSERFAA